MLPEGNARLILNRLLEMEPHQPIAKKVGKVSPTAVGVRYRKDPLTFQQAYRTAQLASAAKSMESSARSKLLNQLEAIAWLHTVRTRLEELDPQVREKIHEQLTFEEANLPKAQDWANHTPDRQKRIERVLTSMVSQRTADKPEPEVEAAATLLAKAKEVVSTLDRSSDRTEDKPTVRHDVTETGYADILKLLADPRGENYHKYIRKKVTDWLSNHEGPLRTHLEVRNALTAYRDSIPIGQETSDTRANDLLRRKRHTNRLIEHWDARHWLKELEAFVEEQPVEVQSFLKTHVEAIVPKEQSLFSPMPWVKIENAEDKLQKAADRLLGTKRKSTLGVNQKKAIVLAGRDFLQSVRHTFEVAKVQEERIR